MKLRDGIRKRDIAKVIASLSSDDIKMEYLSYFFNDDYEKKTIIMSLSSDERKIELMKLLPDLYHWQVISSLSSDEKKADMLETLPFFIHNRDKDYSDYYKSLIIASMSSDYPQLSKLISEIDDENLRTVLEACFSDDDSRITVLTEIDSFENINSLVAETYKRMILEKLSSDESRLQALDIINNRYKDDQYIRSRLNSQIVSRLDSDDKKVELLESGLYGYADEHEATLVISSLLSDHNKMEFLRPFPNGGVMDYYNVYPGGRNNWEYTKQEVRFYKNDIIASLSISDEEKLAMAGTGTYLRFADPSVVRGLKSDKIKMEYIEKISNIKSPIQQEGKNSEEPSFEINEHGEIIKPNNSKTSLQQKEEELSALEAEEKTISEAEALIKKEMDKKGKDIGK